jgi:hypothetical protein
MSQDVLSMYWRSANVIWGKNMRREREKRKYKRKYKKGEEKG